MYKAMFHVIRGNYEILSDPFLVFDMQAELNRMAQFVIERGGTYRKSDERPHYFSDWNGYYNALSFESEFFLEGVIIGLSGRTLKEERFFVNPSLRKMDMDKKSRKEVWIPFPPSGLGGYEAYARDRASGLVEQRPELSDAGYLKLTLEGAVRHLAQDAPEFYAVTGLPENWPIPLQLECPKEE